MFMIYTLPPGVVDRFMSLQLKFRTIHEIQTSSFKFEFGAREMGLSSSVG